MTPAKYESLLSFYASKIRIVQKEYVDVGYIMASVSQRVRSKSCYMAKFRVGPICF